MRAIKVTNQDDNIKMYRDDSISPIECHLEYLLNELYQFGVNGEYLEFEVLELPDDGIMTISPEIQPLKRT